VKDPMRVVLKEKKGFRVAMQAPDAYMLLVMLFL
jgi:hypothetical protein